jgi:fibronectin type 3 domain-containing protein
MKALRNLRLFYVPLIILVIGLLSPPTKAQVSVLTWHYNLARTGANTNETLLTTTNVNQNQFGKLFTASVDGRIYAQPLYVPNVTVNGTMHNVVLVATAANSVYAFDALFGTQLWHNNYGPTPMGGLDVGSTNIPGPIGIIGTPVIDPSTNTIYFVTKHKNADGSFHQFLRAADVATGEDTLGSPEEINATLGGNTFDPLLQNQRPALVLSNGTVYITWASHGDATPYHGWILGYQAANIKNQQYVFSDTMSTARNAQGGFWMGGGAFPVDSEGNIYALSGNGVFDGTSNFGDSFIKLSPSLQVTDYFTPSNQASLQGGDQDLGASSPMLIPGTSNVIGGGKDGRLFLVNTKNMGHFNASTDAVLQEFQGFAKQLRSGPAYWTSPVNGPTIYLWSGSDSGKAYTFTNGLVNTTPQSVTPESGGDGALAISSNGSKAGTGILWASEGGALHAYDASNLATELWNSNQNRGRDGFGATATWVPPIVANGMVYMATNSNVVVAYGILGSIPPPPPTNLVAIPGDNRISLAWNPDTGATSYDVFRGTAPGAEGTSPIATGVQGGGYVDTTAVDGTTYYYTVTATDAAGLSTASNEANTTPGTPVTGTPIYQVSTAGAQPPYSADEFFSGGNVSTHNQAISLEGVIDPAPAVVYQSARAGTLTYTFPSLTPNSPYLIRLHFAETFWTNVSKRLFNVAINGTPVLANFDIFASAGGENQAIVVPANTSSAADGTIVVSFTGGNADQPEISAIEIISPTASNIPATPTGVTAVPGNMQVTLHWNASSGATSYKVFRGTTAGGEEATPIATNITSTTYVDAGLTNGTTFFYRVAAVNSHDTSGASNEVSATPAVAPAAPTLVMAVPGNGSVSLCWTAVSGATSYSVFRATSSGNEGVVPVAANLPATSFVSTGLANGTTYFFVVEAVNAVDHSAPSNELSATPNAVVVVPAPPANLAAVAGNAHVSLSWTASAGGTSYNVYRGTAPGGENATPIATNVTATTYVDAGLTNGTTYFYEVAAANGAEISGMSNEASAMPQAPSALTAVYQINSGGAAVASFAADNFFNAGTTSKKSNTITTAGIADAAPAAVYQSDRLGTFTYTFPGLTPDANYTVRLHFAEVFWTAAGKRLFNVAINGVNVLSKFDIFATAGGSNIAVVKSFTTTANSSGQIAVAFTGGGVDQPEISGIEILTDGPPPIPAAPINLAATAGNGQVLLSWKSGNGPGGTYSVFRGTTPDGEASTPIANGLTATNFTDTTVTNLTTYYYTVKTVNQTASSSPSNEVTSVPGAPLTRTPIYQVHAGGGSVPPYAADEFFTGGGTSGSGKAINTSAVVSPAPQAVYQTQRAGGSFSYTFPNLTPGQQYLVRLHFAEFFWTMPGQRIFNVSINGTLVLPDFDIIAIAGAPNTALVEQLMATADPSGNITVSYTSGTADQPKASAIEIYQQ